jgi:hypothetical protein
MIAINGTWCGLDMTQYRACFEFIQVKGSHLGENLAAIVFNILKRLGILYKVLTLTRDNATNNDTTYRFLYKRMSKKFDDHLTKHRLRDQTM